MAGEVGATAEDDNVFPGDIGQRNARMRIDQRMTVTSCKSGIEQMHDLPLPVIIKVYFRLIEQNQSLCSPKQREEAQASKEALLAIAEPLEEV